MPSDSTSSTGASYSPQLYISPTLSHGLRIWWAYYWPAAIVSLGLSVICLIPITLLVRNGRISMTAYQQAALVLPIILFAAAGIVSFQYILHKRFKTFRIALFPNVMGPSLQILRPSFAHGLRLWWRFTWRWLVYVVIAGFFASFPMNMIAGFLTLGTKWAALVQFLFGILLAAALGLYVIYSSILDEDIGNFSVRLVPPEIVPAAPISPPAKSR
jgi:hypothetical protein